MFSFIAISKSCLRIVVFKFLVSIINLNSDIFVIFLLIIPIDEWVNTATVSP